MKILITIFCAFNLFFRINSEVVRWSFGSFIYPMNKSLEFEVTITSPTIPGTYPVIFFLTGLDGELPTLMYDKFITDIATEKNNAIVVAFDKLGFVHFPDKEEMIFELTLNWSIENLASFFNSDNTPDSIRNKVFPYIGPNGHTLMAHSSGAHPTCLYLYKHCGVIKKLIWLDPVDGYDPFGIVKLYCTNPSKQLPFQIPTLILSTGLDPVPVSVLTACI